MRTVIYIYKSEAKIKKNGYLLILKASDQQRGSFNIEFEGTSVIAKSFSDAGLKSLKGKLIQLFGYPPFRRKNFNEVFQTEGLLSVYIDS